MIEARSFVSEIDTARKILQENGAIFKGEYILTDKIYSSYNPPKGLDDEFLRLFYELPDLDSNQDDNIQSVASYH